MTAMEILLAILGGSVGSALVAGIFGLITWKLNRNAVKEDKSQAHRREECAARGAEIAELNRKMDVLFLADRTILYDRIKHLAKSYLCRGWVTVEELEDLNRMHEVYHDSDKLNGNGFLRELMEKVNTGLEIRTV